jgi:hypothetical protein
VINPINDLSQQGSDLEKLLAEEEAKEANKPVASAPAPAVPAKPIAVVNDLTPPDLLKKQAEERAEEATEKTEQVPPLTPPTPAG